ncbi:MAG TPA: hypothetical protein VGN16_18370 [Acidobacteriaceae bacterium]|jgi:hypothetical protein
MKTPSLASLVGEIITLKIPSLNVDKEFDAKLISVEESGIWIEHISLSQAALAIANVRASRKTMVFFVPFSSISFVVGSLDAPTLSETFLTE